MGRLETLASVREQYPQYADMPDDQLAAALAAKYPEYADLTPPRGNLVRRAYKAVAEPVTEAVGGLVGGALGPYLAPGVKLTPEQERFIGRPAGEVVVPQTLLEAGAMGATGGAGRLLPALYRAAPAFARIVAGAAGGEIGNQLEAGSTGRGAAVGAAGAAGGELLGRGGEIVRRSLPGAKKAISLDDTRRVGRDIADITGAPAMRTPGDIAAATTGAMTRQTEQATAHDAALAAYRQAVADARGEAARLTREGRTAQAAEWQARQQNYQRRVDQLQEEARRATGGLQTTVDAMTARVNEQRSLQAAEGIHEIIQRVSPQLAAALTAPGAAGLRNAGAGGARRALGEAKEAVTKRLEESAPGGIVVPSLAQKRSAPESAILDVQGRPITATSQEALEPLPVRGALEELSLLGADSTTQFARNPLDRNIRGAARRRRYGELAEEIRVGFDEVLPGLGAAFQEGQILYKEGLAVSKALLEPNANYLPGGDVNVPALASNLIKPRMRTVLESKLGPEKYQQVAEGVGGLPRAMPAERVKRLEAVLPEPPVKPAAQPAVEPNIPTEPVRGAPSAADLVMTTLFGPQNRMQQGRDTLINWPAIQKAMQAPRVRAELQAALGEEGFNTFLRSVLRGATEGADVPAAGSGRFLGPLLDLFSGREKGAGFLMTALPRSFLPNFGAHYVGKQPMQFPPALQAILDIALQRAGGAALESSR